MKNGCKSVKLFGLPLPEVPPSRLIEERMSRDVDAARTVEVEIPMRDGTVLAADVHLPAADRLPAPAIVVGTPYDKSGPYEETAAFREYGYVGVTYDVRGRGKSEGVWHPWEGDGKDGYDVVEWVAAQEWCRGKVGMMGCSYMGWVTVATVAEQPPHLGAAAPSAAPGLWFEELPYPGGCFTLWYAFWFTMCRRRITAPHRELSEVLKTLPVEAIGEELELAGPGWDEVMENTTFDQTWRNRHWEGKYEFDVPMMHVTGWHDDTNRGAIHHYEEMVANSPAKDDQFLLAGPWLHMGTRWPANCYDGVELPDAAIDMNGIIVRFFDHYLKGEANGVETEQRVRLYDQGEGTWKVRSQWRGGTEPREIFLAGDGSLAPAPGPEGADAYRYDPTHPSGHTPLGEEEEGDPPFRLTGLEEQEGVVSWTSESLADDLTVRGWSEVDLFAESDREDTDWHVKLADVDLDGVSFWYARGCQRASYGEDPLKPAAIVPGEINKYTIPMTPLFHTFKAGHRIRLLLSSSEFPTMARNLNRFEPIVKQVNPLIATNRIHYGAVYPSCLRLPVEA
jgi:putative CocE/NonD family hydrolase